MVVALRLGKVERQVMIQNAVQQLCLAQIDLLVSIGDLLQIVIIMDQRVVVNLRCAGLLELTHFRGWLWT
jgi:hypothetical protein